MRVVLTFDDHEFQDFLKAWQEPSVKRTLRAAASAYGRTLKPILQAATPVARPGNPYATGPGNLQRSTRFKRMRASYGIGVVIAPMGRSAFYRRFVVGGTKPHVILPRSQGGRLAIAGGFATAVHHPGARANPYVARAGHLGEGIGYLAAERMIFDGLTAKRVLDTLD
jgi:hypothetical protein